MSNDPFATNGSTDENDPFGDGSVGGDFLDETMKDAIAGALVYVEVLKYDADRPTSVSKEGKKSPCVDVNFYVLDGEHAGAAFEDMPLYGAVLPNRLKKYAVQGGMPQYAGKPVLGRWEKDHDSANPKFKKNIPWGITSAKELDAESRALGMKFYNERKAALESQTFGD